MDFSEKWKVTLGAVSPLDCFDVHLCPTCCVERTFRGLWPMPSPRLPYFGLPSSRFFPEGRRGAKGFGGLG